MNSKMVLFLCLITCSISYSQSSEGGKYNDLRINADIVMPEDSLDGVALISAINGFLSLAQENVENEWVLAPEAVETQMLIDEIVNIQKNEKLENDSFYKPYLTNVIPLGKDKYAIHVSYIGTQKDSIQLRASFEFIAHKTSRRFLISSPLVSNTQNWKSKRVQNHMFHYPYDIDAEKVKSIVEYIVFCDEKLDNNKGESHYYMCKEETNPLELFGVKYKSDYNGLGTVTRWVTEHGMKTLWVCNEKNIYDYSLHDLWHNRLGRVIARKEIHRRVDCHIGTLYGGIWGIGWDELFPLFCENYVEGENIDWLDHKNNKSHFITKGRRKNYTDDFVGALLVQKIESELGFDGVWKLLKTKRTKEEEEYFEVLEKLTGITKGNYNKEVQKLIDTEMEKLGLSS